MKQAKKINKYVKNDKRRLPYNLWVGVLSILIFLIVSGMGVRLMIIAYNADVDTAYFKGHVECIRLDTPFERCSLSYEKVEESDLLTETGSHYTIEKEKNNELKGIQILAGFIGAIIIIIGVILGIAFYNKRRW